MRYVIKCKHILEDIVDMKKRYDTYPQQIFATALLLDGKIENWWVGKVDSENQFRLQDLWITDRLDDYKIVDTSWKVYTPEEHDRVINELSVEWFKQWDVAEGYRGFRPY